MEEESDQVSTIAFGASAWKEYFGVEVDEAPDLPGNIEVILDRKAPFLLDGELSPRRVGDNHLLTLIPGTINGEDFTLDKLGELILNNHNNHFAAFQDNSNDTLGRHSHGYDWYSPLLTKENRGTPLEGAPYWVLLPRTIIVDSRHKSLSDHEAMVRRYRSDHYELPRALEVATSLLAYYARNDGERLYASEHHSNGCWTFTRCSDVDKAGRALAVGGFESSGLCVHCYSHHGADHGATVSRRL